METNYQIFETSIDRYWIKTASGAPLWLPLTHHNQGLPKKAIDLLLEDIIFSNPDSDGSEVKPSNSMCYMLYGLMEQTLLFPIEDAKSIEEMIQWDRCYRLEPDPRWQQEQKKSIECVIHFLKNNGIEWVDLRLNYAESLEEMKENDDDEVPADIVEFISALYEKMSDLQKFFVLVLYNFSIDLSITLPILFVSGHITIDEFINGFMHFQYSAEEFSNAKQIKEWKANNKQRILNGQKFLQVIGEDAK
ncbi:MAG: hypothetical protein ACOYN5_01520 [Bacteroidales bacterium]